mmetsp:Transcript_49231/g.130741  ORF Transcript_49231/g.130741 Transcript_49231/m.130741 type:complete len:265 (-) Transcript_49231:184-978(-)
MSGTYSRCMGIRRSYCGGTGKNVGFCSSSVLLCGVESKPCTAEATTASTRSTTGTVLRNMPSLLLLSQTASASRPSTTEPRPTTSAAPEWPTNLAGPSDRRRTATDSMRRTLPIPNLSRSAAARNSSPEPRACTPPTISIGSSDVKRAVPAALRRPSLAFLARFASCGTGLESNSGTAGPPPTLARKPLLTLSWPSSASSTACAGSSRAPEPKAAWSTASSSLNWFSSPLTSPVGGLRSTRSSSKAPRGSKELIMRRSTSARAR